VERGRRGVERGRRGVERGRRGVERGRRGVEKAARAARLLSALAVSSDALSRGVSDFSLLTTISEGARQLWAVDR